MKHQHQLIQLVEEFAKASASPIDHMELDKAKARFQAPMSDNFSAFYSQLIDVGSFAKFTFEVRVAAKADFEKITHKLTYPIIYFKKEATQLTPVILKHKQTKQYETIEIDEYKQFAVNYDNCSQIILSAKNIQQLVAENGFVPDGIGNSEGDLIVYITGFEISNLLNNIDKGDKKALSPVQRFFSLLKAEKRDIKYIYFFAVLIALINLALPLGVQAVVGLISGGLLIESVVILIAMVIVCTGLSGYLQILQLNLVEILQQRVFTNVTFEFAWRLPRIQIESLMKHYTPEMVNRFFDVLNVQKSLPKILIDLTAAVIQIIFGLLLLSLYHPIFIVFSFLIVVIIISILYFTGKKGLETSIYESKYKYKVAYWLQEIGRSINSFKLAGNANLPIQKSDYLLANYLKYRNKHFKVLVKQYAAIVSFKTLITASLLILGSFLVVNRQINLGQFVAAELIIVLIINSVEKLISTLEVSYDLLTALDKIGHVTDLPIESNVGRELHDLNIENELDLKVSNLSFHYPSSKKATLNGIDFQIKQGERVCITGYNDSGKTTFIKTISGLYTHYDGVITLNDVSLKELNINSYRSIIGDNLSQEDVFEGTIEENISMGRAGVEFKHILDATKKTELHNFVSQLEKGLQSEVTPGGLNFPKSIIQKIVLARSFVQQPKLIIIDDFFYNAQKKDKNDLLSNIFANKDWAVVIISSQPSIMMRCDKVCVMNEGKIVNTGTYQELKEQNILSAFISE